MDEFCRRIPKVELHAHLNGSISAETMKVLLERRNKKLQQSKLSHDRGHDIPKLEDVVVNAKKMDSAFEAFRLIHSVVDDEEAISLAACDVVKEFCEDNVKYLELRTTPRANPETGMTKQSYIEAVRNGINKAVESLPSDSITVRLLLSVDRRQEMSNAYDTIRIAHQYSLMDNIQQGKVVGLDLSGHPKAGNTTDIVELLNEAKKLGLKLSVHMAERPDADEDSEGLLSIDIDRIGHGTFLHRGKHGRNSKLVEHVLNNKIPIEICMTSNIKAETVKCYEEHHLKFWRDLHHPVIICTDDKGVFSTTLSEEYSIAAKTFGLNENELAMLSKEAVECIFDNDSLKTMLKKSFDVGLIRDQ